MRCSVQNCSSDTKRTNKSNGITFHTFPKEPTLRSIWTEALGVAGWDPKERSAVCSAHFRNEDFYETKTGLRKVKSGAVPVIVNNSSENLDSPAALRACRICLAMDTRLFDIREQKLDQFYQQITGIFVNEEDRLPQCVCWECAERLRSAAKFRGKALRAHTAVLRCLHPDRDITVRDIRSIDRVQNQLVSSLGQKIYDCNDADLHIRGDNIIKVESQCDDSECNGSGECNANGERNDNGDMYNGDVKDLEITDIDIKDESGYEIFLSEYNDFESDDEKTLSVFSNKIVESTKVDDAKDCQDSKIKVKKRKFKEKRVKPVKSIKKSEVKKRDEDEDPETTMDKYKVSDIKRRKTSDGLDESLFTITALTYDEQIAEVERRQESAAYKNALFKCTACYRGFMIRDRHEAHVVRHSEKCGMFECFICKTRLKTGRALRKHITAQHTEKFSCKGCPFVTRNRGVAREHEKWHAGTKYQCPHCAMEFDKLTTYMGHIRIKHASDFVCALCGYTFVSQKGIDVHKRKKHRLIDDNVPLEGPFCEMCNVKFVSEEAHERHLKLSSRHMTESDPNRLRNDSQSMNAERNGRVMRRIERRPLIHPRSEPENAPRPVTCEQCGVQLRDLRLYAQHFRRAHPDKNRTKYPAMKTPCMCELCGRIFQSMALLKDHMWVHTGEKRFKCTRCPKSFTQKSNLVFHERVHGDARPSFPCPLCGKHFAFYNNRRRHMFSATPRPLDAVFHERVHGEARPSFPCPLCGKHFAFYNNRRRHMFIHTGLKPFKCETCGKCFTTGGEQRAHVEHVHMKKPWPKRARRDPYSDKCPEP